MIASYSTVADKHCDSIPPSCMPGWLCAHTPLSNGWKRFEVFVVVYFSFEILRSSSFLSFLTPLVRWVPYAGHCCWNGLVFSFLLGRCEGPSLFDVTTLIRLRSFIFILFWDEDLMGFWVGVRMCVCARVSDYVCAFMMSDARMLGNMAWPGEWKRIAKHRPMLFVCVNDVEKR